MLVYAPDRADQEFVYILNVMTEQGEANYEFRLQTFALLETTTPPPPELEVKEGGTIRKM